MVFGNNEDKGTTPFTFEGMHAKSIQGKGMGEKDTAFEDGMDFGCYRIRLQQVLDQFFGRDPFKRLEGEVGQIRPLRSSDGDDFHPCSASGPDAVEGVFKHNTPLRRDIQRLGCLEEDIRSGFPLLDVLG